MLYAIDARTGKTLWSHRVSASVSGLAVSVSMQYPALSKAAGEAAVRALLDTVRPDALAADTVPVIACPVDYTENLRLTDALDQGA